MKKFTLVLLTILTISLFSFERALASHMTGAAITYNAVPGSPNQFIITLKLYRDCFGIQYEPNPRIDFVSPSGCGASGFINLDSVPGTGEGNEIQTSNYPPCAISTCNGGTAYGIEEWVYTGMIDLGAACNDWVISYRSCCRNAALNTADPVDMYVETTINNLDFAGDNSPVFTHPPVATFCVGRAYQFDMSATDMDGDSLVYILTDAWEDAGSPVSYNPPYSGSYPVASSPPPSINPQTGVITFYPTTVQVGVLAILVESYDPVTGQLIGTIRRDMQINVEAVCNDPPHLDTVQVHMRTVTVPCADSVLYMKLTWQVRCNTLAADGSDFRMLAPSGIPVLIKGAQAVACNAIGLADSIKLFLRGQLCENGQYAILSKVGYDGNTLLNGCGIALPEYDTLRFPFNNCYPGIPNLYNVTVNEFDNSQCDITWGIPPALDTNLFYAYEIYRSSNGPAGFYTQIGRNYDWSDTTFSDPEADPDMRAYTYAVRIELTNCAVSPLGDSIQSMYLTCHPNADSLSIDLNWTPYWGWPSPNYEIWLSDGTDTVLALTGNTSSNAYNFLRGDLGSYRVRIKTINLGMTSWSNWCNYDILKNEPFIYNVITPNSSDPLNSTLHIDNINAYPENKLTIFNRWGKKVYEASPYVNDPGWDGGGLEDGTYYYVLIIEGRRPFEFHGTINIFNGK